MQRRIVVFRDVKRGKGRKRRWIQIVSDIESASDLLKAAHRGKWREAVAPIDNPAPLAILETGTRPLPQGINEVSGRLVPKRLKVEVQGAVYVKQPLCGLEPAAQRRGIEFLENP